MLQTMGNLKLDFRTIIFAFAILFTSCSENTKRDIYFVLDMAGVLIPSETRIDLPLKNEQTEEVFSFQDYCNEKYDSIFLVYPYFNTEKKDFKNIRMSCRLKDICESNTLSDSYSTILFINGGIVKAYSIMATANADFNAREVEKHYIFPIDQKFIMDKDRNIHLYKE